MGFFAGASSRRHGWVYKYTGSELLPFAERLAKETQATINSKQSSIGKLMQVALSVANREQLDKDKSEMEKMLNQLESCVVWCHEFKRRPNAEFSLEEGDVMFFRLSEPIEEK